MSRSSYRWAAVSVFGLASTWNYLDRLVLAAAAPRIKAEFHLTNTDFGWLLSAFYFAYALASPVAGWLLDRLGIETGIVCAVSLWSVAAALCGWTQSFAQLLAARVFLGAGESAGVPAAGKLNAIYLEPENRAIGAAITQVGFTIGGVVAPLLVAAFLGWRAPFFVCSALGLIWIPVWLAVRHSIPPANKPPRRNPGNAALLTDRTLLALTVANFLWMTAYGLWSGWTMLYLTQTFALTTSRASAYAWFPPIASTAGAFAGGWMSRAIAARGTAIVSARIRAMLICALGCLVTVIAPWCSSPFWATLVIAASYFWTTAGSVNLYTIPVDIWGEKSAGTAVSALGVAYGFLQVVISPAIGHLVDHFGFTPVFILIAFPPLAAWLLLRFTPLPEAIHQPVRGV